LEDLAVTSNRIGDGNVSTALKELINIETVTAKIPDQHDIERTTIHRLNVSDLSALLKALRNLPRSENDNTSGIKKIVQAEFHRYFDKNYFSTGESRVIYKDVL